MKIQHLFSIVDRKKITEGYVKEIGEYVNPDMTGHFAAHGKLTGNLREDVNFLTNFSRLFEEDEEFDPFGHLVATDKIVPEEDCVLTFSTGNDKLQKLAITAFDLPAGYTCPFAKVCKTIAHKTGGKFAGGKSIKQTGDVRCYAASGEAIFPNVRKMRWRNFDLLNEFKGNVEGMAQLILRSMDFHESKKPRVRVMRIHSAGDFFSQEYFDAWTEAARQRDDVLFYAYTKSLPFWQKRKANLPGNFRLIASEGGKRDELIDKEQFRHAVIVKDKGEAIRRKLNIDINDFLAALGDENFALLMHGSQKAGPAAKQSYANAAIIKQAAQQFGVDPREFERLLAFYTKGERQKATAASKKRQQAISSPKSRRKGPTTLVASK